ncbi:endonuclease toxin domain-containing protein [Verminephrobacter aporrectodeae]|uniref:endonuclease toxin domain-containing protein n=1 Tax=Verminephrobacter aporrectodeae TaxID=1110389 RepID=UPI002242F065|nr:hypothetical protein [Verminephrobacter aporrectodeae]
MLDKRQPNHKTFNFFNPTTGHAVSVKTMDTLGLSGSKPMTPEGAAGYLRRYVQEVVDYEKSVHQTNGVPENSIQSKTIELAIPEGTPIKVHDKLNEVARDALVQGVQVIISVVAVK